MYAYRFRIVEMMLITWFVLLAAVAHAATHAAPLCPIFPNPASVPAADVLGSPEVKDALRLVDELLQNASTGIPSGLIATVIFDQNTAWTKGYGYKDVKFPSQGPPSEHSLVRIASITKVFTSMLLYILRDKGSVNLEDDLTKYMPMFSIQSSGKITLRELASHTSGLPRETPYPCSSFEYPGCNESEVLKSLSTKAAVSPVHRRFHYSNLGMALLGRALEHVGEHASYEDLVEKYITKPMMMTNATFAYNQTTMERSAKGTDKEGKEVKVPVGPSCGFGAPAGCLWASAGDIGMLMKLLFRADSTKKDDPLGGSTISEMLAPEILLRNGFEAVGTPFEMQYVSNRYWTKGKQGELPGYRSSMTIVDELRLGVFTSALVSDVDEDSVWTIPALEILAPAFEAALNRLQPSPQLPKNYQRMEGSYYDGSVTIEADGQTLVFKTSKDGARLQLKTDPTIPPDFLRAHDIDGLSTLGCRWKDDGTDQELVQFIMGNGAGHKADEVVAIEFMGARYNRRSGE